MKHVARRLLPRPLADRATSVVAAVQRRRDEAKLPTAENDFERAYRAYWSTCEVVPDAAERLFLATWASGGIGPRSLVPQLARPYDPHQYASFHDDLLRDLDPEAVARAVDAAGCYVSPVRLPAEVVEEILGVLERGPAQPRGDGLGGLPPGAPSAKAPTWWMRPQEILQSSAARRLLLERRLVAAAGNYLRVDPMIMSVVLWKSFAWSGADKRSAQHFHYDNDRPSFIKCFVYLTDVDERNGAHVYVRGSHREKPRPLLHGQRLADDDVARYYPPTEWEVITGSAGTVFFADTQGFHKGGHVAHGERAMFQINLASDRFGIREDSIGPADAAPTDLRPFVESHARFFSQLFEPSEAAP